MEKNTKNSMNYKAIVYTLLPEISKGLYNDYHRFPTENELCNRFNVNRTTVREALKVLQFLELISSTQGSCYKVTTNFDDSFKSILTTLLSYQKFTYKDISDIREALEIKTLLLIHEKSILDTEKKFLLECIENMKKKNSALQADRDFHNKLAELSGNQLIKEIVYALSTISQKYMEGPWTVMDDEEIKILVDKHKDIVDSFEEKKDIIKENSISGHYKFANEIMEKNNILFSNPELIDKSITELIDMGYTTNEIINLTKQINAFKKNK